MASLPIAIKEMLEATVGVANDDITFGMRKQGGALPAVYYMIDTNETLVIGSTNKLFRASLTIKSVATTVEDAWDTAMAVEASLLTGTYDTIVFCGIINNNSLLESPESGNGEEQIPFTATTLCDIIFTL